MSEKKSEVHRANISDESLRKSPAEILVNSSKFPLLKGGEASQIERRIVELIHADKIKFKEIFLRETTYTSEYLGLTIFVRVNEKDKLLIQGRENSGGVFMVTFRGEFNDLLKAIRSIVRPEPLSRLQGGLEKIWEILNEE